MNFERGKTPKEAIGIGGYATGIHIVATLDRQSGFLARTKLKTTRKVLYNLGKDPKWYESYDQNIYLEIDPRHYEDFRTRPMKLGAVRLKELAGKILIYKGRLYPLVPLPPEE